MGFLRRNFMNQSELIEQLQTTRSWIEGMVAQLSPEQWEMPGVQDSWSVKDILAHLTAWDRRGTQWIEWAGAVAQGTVAQPPQAGYTFSDMDRLNRETFAANKDRPFREIWDEFRQSFAPLLQQIQALREEDWDRVVQADWTGHQPAPIRDIVAWRFYHCLGHGRYIENWIDQLKQRETESR